MSSIRRNTNKKLSQATNMIDNSHPLSPHFCPSQYNIFCRSCGIIVSLLLKLQPTSFESLASNLAMCNLLSDAS